MRRRLKRTRTSAYHRRCPAGAACCGACNDHAAVALALLGMGAADGDDQTVDVDDRADAFPRRCGQHRSTASLTQLSSSCKQTLMRRMPRTQGRGPRLRLFTCFDCGSAKAHRFASGGGAIGQRGLRQDHDEQRRNACFRGGLETAHGHDAGAGEGFRHSRTGTNSSTRVMA